MAEVLDALRRDGDSSNTIIGVVILILMSVFVAPDVLPQLVAETLPFIDEGLPCQMLMVSQDRANHQSLIGREATNALIIRTELNEFNPNGTNPLVIRVIIINQTIGTVPIVFNPDQVIAGPNQTNGMGVIFNPGIAAIPANFTGSGISNTPGSTVATNIRVLGPRQRCVHKITIPADQVGLLGIQPGRTEVRGYYRVQGPGTITQVNPAATPIFGDQGLDILINNSLESAGVIVPTAVFSAEAQSQ